MKYTTKWKVNVMLPIVAVAAITVICTLKFFDVIAGTVFVETVNGGTAVTVEAFTFLIALSVLITTGLNILGAAINTLATEPEPNPIIEYEKVRHKG